MTDITDLNILAKTWIALHYSDQKSDEYKNNFWSYDKVCDLCTDNPEICWNVILLIRELDSSDFILANLAAGPLEDLLNLHGRGVIESIEKSAKLDPAIKKMLEGVWESDIPKDVWERVQRIK